MLNHEARLHVGVLGAVEVRRGDEIVPLAPALRTVLAALALDAGRVVDADVLAERIWNGDRTAASTMHSAVSRLRRALGADVVLTRAPGYRLLVEPGQVDGQRFEALVAHARTLVQQHDPTAARTAVAEALDLWRGPAYADVPSEFAREEARRLEARHLEALELRARVDLDLGRHREVVVDLTTLVEVNPLHEDLRAALALALYRSSRQAEALRVLDEGRRLLSEELGIDPGPELRRLRDLVLRQDPSLDGPEPAAPQSLTRRNATPPPVAATELVGREADVETVLDLLATSRLLTLTGTGGVGKTRVAAAVVAAVVGTPAFPDGSWFVPLAALSHASAVLPAVSRALGLPVVEDCEALETVVSAVGGGRALLVLDNCEHLLDVAADVASLLARCPDLTVLVTSRAPLRIGGEREFRVEPLDVGAATELFVARAIAVAPEFVHDERTAEAVAEICRRVAGIPLAVELAAARVRVLHVRDLADRLDQALAGGARDLPERQRTMRATLDWSYGLLDERAQKLFRRLGLFTGGWTLEVLEELEGLEVLETLQVLVEHSLVRVDFDVASTGRPARYSMLEPILQHARRLLAGPEHATAALAHARAHVQLAERACAAYRGAAQVFWLDRMEDEHPNVLAAFDWAMVAGERELADRLVWASWLFWWLRGHVGIGRRCTDAIVAAHVAAHPGPPTLALVRARTAGAAMAFAQGDEAAGRAAWAQALDWAELMQDCTAVERAEAIAQCEAGLGISALVRGDLAAASRGHRRAIELAEPLPAESWGPWIVRLNRIWSATAAAAQGRLEDARTEVHLGLDLARDSGDRLATYMALYNLALVESDPARAAQALLEGVRLSEQVGDRANLAYFVELLLVRFAGSHTDPQRLFTLAVVARAARETVGFEVYRYYPRDAEAVAEATASVAGRLSEHLLQQAESAGRAASMAEVVALAEVVVSGAGLTPDPAAAPTRTT